MGALNYMLAGAGAGLGQGMASIGARMGADADREELLRMQMDRDRQNIDQRGEQARGLAELKAELAADRAAAKAGTGKAGAAPLDPQSDQARSLMVASSRGALSDAQVRDAQAIWRGETPTAATELPGPPTEDGKTAGTGVRAKYNSTQSRALLDQATSALDRAFMINNMGDADKYAKGTTEAQKGDYAREYVKTGNAQSARGALLLEGKDLNNKGSDVVTGAVTPGSVAQSEVGENRAQAASAYAAAGKYKEEAASTRGKRDGNTPESIRDDLLILEGERKKITADMADLRAREKAAQESMDKGTMATVQERRKKLEEQSAALDDKFREVATRKQAIREGKKGAELNPPKAADTKVRVYDKSGKRVQ